MSCVAVDLLLQRTLNPRNRLAQQDKQQLFALCLDMHLLLCTPPHTTRQNTLIDSARPLSCAPSPPPALIVLHLSILVLACMHGMQVVALLAGRYLTCWDVRYHTLRTLTRLAQQRAVRGDAAAARGGDESDEDGEGPQQPPSAAAAAGAGGGDDQQQQQQQQSLSKAAADVARTMFDVLAAVQPIMPRSKQQQQQQDEEDGEEQEQVPSWCGAAEVRNKNR